VSDPLRCLIRPIDGRAVTLRLSAGLLQGGPAPGWLPAALGLAPGPWRLVPRPAAGGRPRFDLVRSVVAAAFDPRLDRLRAEWRDLQQLNDESDTVYVEPLYARPGVTPDRYKVTFRCKGIINIDAGRQPVYGEFHQVELECDSAFPADPPRMKWLTPVWHPNIQHVEPKGVCINRKEWLGGMTLVDLCRQLLEMVQYKNYHAELIEPYPLDRTVAEWVRDFAEPHGIVNKRRHVSVDDRPLTRPTVRGLRIKVTSSGAVEPPPSADSSGRIKVLRHEG
jgi:ubiquitin-protein ligase